MKKILIFALIVGMLAASWYQLIIVGNNDGERFEEYEAEAAERMEAGYYVEALESVEAGLAIDANSQEMQLMNAYCYYKLDKGDEFIKLANNYMSLYGGDEKLYLYEADYYEEQFDYQKALVVLEEGALDFPESADLLAELLAVKGKYSEEYTSYTYISEYFDGYAIAENENGFRLINESGSTADGNIDGYKEIYDFYKNDNDELIIAVNDGEKSCYYDASGNLRLSPEENYEFLGGFRDGYALVKNENGWFYIDKDFNVCSDIYQDATSFYNGMAAVKKDGKWILTDKEFKQIGANEYDDVLLNEERICNVSGSIIVEKDSKYYVSNSKGELISEGYENAKNFAYNGTTAAVEQNGKWGLIDVNGTVVVSPEYDDILPDGEGLAACKTGDKWGYRELDGQIIIEPAYEECRAFNKKGYASVLVDDVWKFLRLETYNSSSGLL